MSGERSGRGTHRIGDPQAAVLRKARNDGRDEDWLPTSRDAAEYHDTEAKSESNFEAVLDPP